MPPLESILLIATGEWVGFLVSESELIILVGRIAEIFIRKPSTSERCTLNCVTVADDFVDAELDFRLEHVVFDKEFCVLVVSEEELLDWSVLDSDSCKKKNNNKVFQSIYLQNFVLQLTSFSLTDSVCFCSFCDCVAKTFSAPKSFIDLFIF